MLILAPQRSLMQVPASPGFPFMSISSSRDGRQAAGLARPLCLLCLAGVAMRMTLLAMPPVIPLVHDDLHMSETQVGLLVGLPLAVFALAAVPGSLLIARIGATLAVILGMAIAALGGAARGRAVDVWTLYAAAIVIRASASPSCSRALPTLVREWLPKPHRARHHRLFLRHGAWARRSRRLSPLPFVLPSVGGNLAARSRFLGASRRSSMAPVFFLLSPQAADERMRRGRERQAVVAGLEGSGGLVARAHLRRATIARYFVSSPFSATIW